MVDKNLQSLNFPVIDFNESILPIHIGVTGHRDIPDEDIVLLKKSVKNFLIKLRETYPNTKFRLNSGLAEGADQLVTEVAIELGIEVIATLPMPIDKFLDDFPELEKKNKFLKLYNMAKIQYICDSSEHIDNRDKYYVSLAHHLVSNSQLILALWDGKNEAILEGGTAYVVKQCVIGTKTNPEILLSHPEKTLITHFKTRRIRNIQSNSEEVQVDEVGNINESVDYFNFRNKKRIDAPLLKKIDDFNLNSKKQKITQDKLLESKSYLIGVEENKVKNLPANILNAYLFADNLANLRQKNRLNLIKNITLIAIAALIMQQLYSGPDMYWLWLFIHIFFATIAFSLFYIFFKGNSPREEQFIEWRVLSEELRIQFFWQVANLKSNISDYVKTNRIDEVDWISQSVRNLSFLDNLNVQQSIGLSDSYGDDLQFELVKKYWLINQYNYFNHAKGKNIKLFKRFSVISKLLFATAVLLTIVTLLVDLIGLSKSDLGILIFISGICYLFTAVSQTYSSQMGFENNAKRYQRSCKIFERAIMMMNNNTVNNLTLFKEIGVEALYENMTWLELNKNNQFEVNI